MNTPKYRQTPFQILVFLSFLIGGCLLGGSLFGYPPVSKAASMALPPSESEASQKSIIPLQMEQKTFPQGTIYTLKVPAQSQYKVVPLVSKTLATIESPAWQNLAGTQKPVFIINGGFFDPNNSLTTSYVFQNGVMTADPHDNPQLVNNPKLAQYLPKIFNRSEFRIYQCMPDGSHTQTRYDIAPRNAPVPQNCKLQDALGAGPALLPKVEDVAEGFVDHNAAGKIIRDPIGVCTRNARSVVGLTQHGDVLLLMGAENPDSPKNSGFTLAEMASLLKARGAVKAMALDGGSSSSLSFEQIPIYGKLNKQGDVVKRPVKSVLVVLPR